MASLVKRFQLPALHIPSKEILVDSSKASQSIGGTLSPDLQPNTPPTFTSEDQATQGLSIGQYLLLDRLEHTATSSTYKTVHLDTRENSTCKVIPHSKFQSTVSAYYRSGYHDNVNNMEEVIMGQTKGYLFFPPSYGDLHSYVRSKRKLKEPEARKLFTQIVSAVVHCHENGVILRDLKLRKFVFKNAERTEVKLEGLEDAYILEDDQDDSLSDKHGCPAYVAPEILNPPSKMYSGRAADMWSVGVMLYTILVGRYPFHDTEPSALFNKIRMGQFMIPDCVSSRAKCLIRSLLRRDPCERLTADQVLQHPWFKSSGYMRELSTTKESCASMPGGSSVAAALLTTNTSMVPPASAARDWSGASSGSRSGSSAGVLGATTVVSDVGGSAIGNIGSVIGVSSSGGIGSAVVADGAGISSSRVPSSSHVVAVGVSWNGCVASGLGGVVSGCPGNVHVDQLVPTAPETITEPFPLII